MSKTDQKMSVFDQFASLMEQNIKGVKIGCYSVALIGLTIAVRRVRPFSKFKVPRDIPSHFVKAHKELIGTVERIEPNGPLLMVDHKPLIAFPFANKGSLPIKVSGVNVTGNGLSWLQTIVAGNEIRFIPILKEKNWVQCQVLLDQETHDKKRRTVNVGESLIAIGFASMCPIEKPLPVADPQFNQYVNSLKRAQEMCLRKMLGYKYYIKPTKSVLVHFGNKVGRLLRTSSKKGANANVSKVATA